MKQKHLITITGLAILTAFVTLFLSQKEANEAVNLSGTSEQLLHQTVAQIDQTPRSSATQTKKEDNRKDSRINLTEICEQTGLEPKFSGLTDEDRRIQSIELEERLNTSMQQLAQSSSIDSQITSQYFETDPEIRIRTLEKAVAARPNDALVLWTAVNECTKAPETECPLREWEDQLTAVDDQNGEAWIRVAANRYADGDKEAAFAAMQRAASASESNLYWAERIELVQRGLAATGAYEFSEGAAAAVGIAAANMPIYSHYIKMCRDQSANNLDWAYACLEYAELTTTKGKTELGLRVGLAMKRQALDDIGKHDQASEVVAQIESRKEEFRTANLGEDKLFNKLGLATPSLFAFYLDNLKQHGELKAIHIMEEEITRLLDIQPELACSALPF
ncbi:MAG: hypothetical protein AB8G18_09290 [Gammaproteobacteria bacterium]